MVGIYFSGTGNTKFCLERFVTKADPEAKVISISDPGVSKEIKENECIVFGYPIYFSNLPKIVRDFIDRYKELFRNKKIYIIATMGLFSGDGAGCSARLFKKYGAVIIGGLHIKMPDCIGDKKALKKSLKDNKELVKKAEDKIDQAAKRWKDGRLTQEGIGNAYHLAGLFGQRLWFYNKTKKYSDALKINSNLCVGCGKCSRECPMKNIHIKENKAISEGKCTMCYRCVSYCPKQAITLLGNHVYEQCRIERYL
ncbi:MAG: EFR1 family ferrodoxin [bacterium]|nr:EFR1 family ferrodoxin [bacterium]